MGRVARIGLDSSQGVALESRGGNGFHLQVGAQVEAQDADHRALLEHRSPQRTGAPASFDELSSGMEQYFRAKVPRHGHDDVVVVRVLDWLIDT